MSPMKRNVRGKYRRKGHEWAKVGDGTEGYISLRVRARREKGPMDAPPTTTPRNQSQPTTNERRASNDFKIMLRGKLRSLRAWLFFYYSSIEKDWEKSERHLLSLLFSFSHFQQHTSVLSGWLASPLGSFLFSLRRRVSRFFLFSSRNSRRGRTRGSCS